MTLKQTFSLICNTAHNIGLIYLDMLKGTATKVLIISQNLIKSDGIYHHIIAQL